MRKQEYEPMYMGLIVISFLILVLNMYYFSYPVFRDMGIRHHISDGLCGTYILPYIGGELPWYMEESTGKRKIQISGMAQMAYRNSSSCIYIYKSRSIYRNSLSDRIFGFDRPDLSA